MKQIYFAIQGAVAAFIAWLSAKLGILLPVMCVLMGMMIIDYITGMLASKRESLEHPDDPSVWMEFPTWRGRHHKKGGLPVCDCCGDGC